MFWHGNGMSLSISTRCLSILFQTNIQNKVLNLFHTDTKNEKQETA